MDLLRLWLGVAVATYALAGLLFAWERLSGWRRNRSIRARLRVLRAGPPPPAAWGEAAADLPPWPQPRRTCFGRRPPHLLSPGHAGRPILEGHAEQVHA
jgi:hypothetical protein